MKSRKTTPAIVSWVLSLVFLTTTGALSSPGVEGWLKAGSDAAGYSIGTEETDHGVVAYIQSEEPQPSKFGTIMQRFVSDSYKGKRLRLSAQVKAVDVQDFSGMWMRVDFQEKIVAFDNMMLRPIKGTTDWQPHAIVLDVPLKSDVIMIGLILKGDGKVYWDDLKLEEVGPEVDVTGFVNPVPADEPTNLDFDQ